MRSMLPSLRGAIEAILGELAVRKGSAQSFLQIHILPLPVRIEYLPLLSSILLVSALSLSTAFVLVHLLFFALRHSVLLS